jgi:hypothetical protein
MDLVDLNHFVKAPTLVTPVLLSSSNSVDHDKEAFTKNKTGTSDHVHYFHRFSATAGRQPVLNQIKRLPDERMRFSSATIAVSSSSLLF